MIPSEGGVSMVGHVYQQRRAWLTSNLRDFDGWAIQTREIVDGEHACGQRQTTVRSVEWS